MATKLERKGVALAFDEVVGGRPLFEDSDGPVYGDYCEDSDMMRFGTVCNTGLIPNGTVRYDHSQSLESNIETLVERAKDWSAANGSEVGQ